MSATVIIVVSVIAIIVIALIAASLFFYKLAIKRANKDFLAGNPDLEVNDGADISVYDSKWVDSQTFETLSITSDDGLTLRGHYLKAKKPTQQTVILAHGYSGKGKDMAALAELYYESLGFNVLMPDNRGHGESEGKYIGFGWHDRKDYIKWIDEIVRRDGKDARIVLHGISMGGATVLMTSGERLPEQVKCLIADCAYSSVKDILTYQLKRMYKLPPFPFIPLTSLVCKLRAGYFFGEASAMDQVARNEKPILFIHGEEDTFVPTEMVHRLYEKSKGYKEIFLVPQAGHGTAYATDKTGYARKVKKFVQRFVGAGEQETFA